MLKSDVLRVLVASMVGVWMLGDAARAQDPSIGQEEFRNHCAV